jgi:hypothetical protein
MVAGSRESAGTNLKHNTNVSNPEESQEENDPYSMDGVDVVRLKYFIMEMEVIKRHKN